MRGLQSLITKKGYKLDLNTKLFYSILFFALFSSEIVFSRTLTKEEEVHCKEVGYRMSNTWRSYGDGFKISAILERPGCGIYSVKIFEMTIRKKYPQQIDSPYEVLSAASVEIEREVGLCKIQPYSINPSQFKDFYFDGDTISFKYGCDDVTIARGERLDSRVSKCHALFIYRYWDEKTKNWIEVKSKSVDGIKIGEVILW